MRRNRYDFRMSGPANDDDLDIDKRKRSIHSVPFIFANALFAALIGLFFVAHAIDSILPTPVSIADEVIVIEHNLICSHIICDIVVIIS